MKEKKSKKDKKVSSKIGEGDFLLNYDPKSYDSVAVTVDVVIFGISRKSSGNYRKLDEQSLNVLLVKRNEHPFKDFYSLPGSFVKLNETLEDTAHRIVATKTSLKDIYMEQLYTFGQLERDPRMRVISCSYISLIDMDKITSTKEWVNVDDIEKMDIGFDHKNIINEALLRLKNKINYTDLVFYMMPECFTISQLQEVYEIILGKKLIPAAFRRTIADKIEETKQYTSNSGHRPSRLFRFKGDEE